VAGSEVATGAAARAAGSAAAATEVATAVAGSAAGSAAGSEAVARAAGSAVWRARRWRWGRWRGRRARRGVSRGFQLHALPGRDRKISYVSYHTRAISMGITKAESRTLIDAAHHAKGHLCRMCASAPVPQPRSPKRAPPPNTRAAYRLAI